MFGASNSRLSATIGIVDGAAGQREGGRAGARGRVDDERAGGVEHRIAEQGDVEDRRAGGGAGDQHVGQVGAEIDVDPEPAGRRCR